MAVPVHSLRKIFSQRALLVTVVADHFLYAPDAMHSTPLCLRSMYRGRTKLCPVAYAVLATAASANADIGPQSALIIGAKVWGARSFVVALFSEHSWHKCWVACSVVPPCQCTAAQASNPKDSLRVTDLGAGADHVRS